LKALRPASLAGYTSQQSRILTTMGALCGVAAGSLIYFAYWLVRNPGFGPTEFGYHIEEQDWGGSSIPAFLILGGIAGSISMGYLLGRPFAVKIFRVAMKIVLMVVGGVFGASLGIAAYLFMRGSQFPEERLVDSLNYSLAALSAPAGEPVLAFALVGFATGGIVATYLVGGRMIKDVSRALTGAVIGGVAGLVIYSIAYVITYYPSIPNSSDFVVHFAEAIYSFSPVEYLLIGLGVALGLMMAKYSWRLYGVFTLIALVSVVLGYLMYSLAVTIPSVEPGRRVFSIILFIAEASTLTLVVLYSFYTIDVATRKKWRRTPRDATFSQFYMPKVVFQVPCYNEPADMVIETVKSLLRVDYPSDRAMIQVIDDSTKPECSEPLRRFCQKYGVMYLQRENRRGYKAGALNYALQFTPADVELIAIIDADYQVLPEYLRETLGFFINPDLGWLQTPQDYRNRDQSFLTEQYYIADAYFYRSVLPSRNEENTIIFCGTMGILRKRALVEVGGWGEKYITEDAELSVRLAQTGWKSLYVNKTYGRGLIPSTFEGYKKQHYRWAFGGGKILRGHFTDFLFGRLSGRQWYDYFLGNVHWFEGFFILIIAASVLAMGFADIFGFEIVSHHTNEIMLIGLVPWFLLVDGLSRLHMVLRKTMNLGFGGTFRVLGMWFSVKFSNGFGAFKALIGFELPFLRTPKAPSARMTPSQALSYALKLTRFETTVAGLMGAAALGVLIKTAMLYQYTGVLVPSRIVLAFWLLSYTAVFLTAPLYAYKSYATFKPLPAAQPKPIPRGVPQ
jgi:cellulose synthase/poly-beta-1,6-N-acetylglucosamine synthase-like glycosyltransferase